MSSSTTRVLFPATCLLAWIVAGCGSDGARPFGGDGTGGHLGGNTGGAPGNDGGAAGEPGTGGMPDGTGGHSSSGGARGSGGTTGTGGDSAASGGRSGLGGHIGSGGAGNVGGPGGFKGSGGIVGSGGHAGTGGAPASGGSPGSGGSAGGAGGGPDPAKCDQLAADYQKEMPNAKMCMIGTSVPQCQTMIAASLGCSCGNTYVETPTTLKDIAAKWTNEGCGTINRVCPLIACILPQPGNCVASTAGTSPQCQSGPGPVLQN